MNQILQAFSEGMAHIFCLDAVDHILFLLVLCASYDYSMLKRIFWLVTAFTIGHAFTFVLSALGYTPSVRSWAEIMIPFTILITAIVNWYKPERQKDLIEKGKTLIYLLTISCGSIHGLAIGSMIRIKLDPGENFISQLIGFNLGVEVAQIAVVVLILATQRSLRGLLRIKLVHWKIGVSGIGFGAALLILLDTL
ncbi:MAG TPA: hypothetical protein DHU89_01005 [Flavobacteriales bacterium]|nr:hypothetical protein [Flavobacteriales bacterium]